MKNLLSVQEQLKSGKANLKDISENYIENIKSSNPDINAFVHFDEEEVGKKLLPNSKKIDAGTAGNLAGCGYCN
jgi:aspartyl-tRNA(Asn)/glutamyl-tRNA(Gln) amidotransferase subunit A